MHEEIKEGGKTRGKDEEEQNERIHLLIIIK